MSASIDMRAFAWKDISKLLFIVFVLLSPQRSNQTPREGELERVGVLLVLIPVLVLILVLVQN